MSVQEFSEQELQNAETPVPEPPETVGDGLGGAADARRNAVRQRRVDRLERRWWLRRIVNVFIVWHLFALAVWLLPDQGILIQGCVGAVRPYMTVGGFAQSWNMFSPTPDHLDAYLEARVTYADGETSKPYFFPRLVHMGYVRRYQEERWRKIVENATHGTDHALWGGLARYAARQMPGDAQNPAVSVILIQHSRLIPPPGSPIPDYTAQPLQDGSKPFVTPIRPEDLQ